MSRPMDVPPCCPDTRYKAGLAVWLSSSFSVAALYSIQQIPEIEGDVRACVRASVAQVCHGWLMQGWILGVFCPDNLSLLLFDPAKLR